MKTTHQSILLNLLNVNVKYTVVSGFNPDIKSSIVEEVKVKIVYDGHSSYLWI